MNKQLFKKTWPLWCIIPFLIWIVVAYVLIPEQPLQEISESGAMVMYNGEWIGGNIVGDDIILKNGTRMSFDEFKRITGFKLE